MGRLVVISFLTLDGVMQSPGMPEEDRDGGFVHGGWQVPYFDDDMGAAMPRLDALLLGRRTYEIFAGYWPYAPGEERGAAELNSAPKYVVSRTLDTVEWQNSTLRRGDLAEGVRRLKDDYDQIVVFGSGNLVQTLTRLGLVDVFNVWVYPVLLGSGKRLFVEGTTPTALRLTDSTVLSSGAVVLSYEPAGAPTYGTTALDHGA